jgi:transcriptional regulator with XRE-family HTH domain
VRTLAERLDYLFNAVHPPGRGRYSYQDAADAITAATGVAITHTTLWALTTGRQTNPQLDTLRAIAQFFKVPVSYFTDEDVTEIAEELQLLASLRDSQLDQGHLRTLAELPPEAQEHIAAMIISTARMEQSRRHS